MPPTPSFEIVSAPELPCTAWSESFGRLAGRDAVAWVAADSTHVAVQVSDADFNESPVSDWDAVATAAVRDNEARKELYLVEEIGLGAANPPAGVPFLYIVRMDVREEAEVEFNRWYTEDHIANLSRVPGVYSARRFIATNESAPRKYLAAYYLTCPSIRQTAAWQRAAHTEWSVAIRQYHVGKLATMFARTSHC